MTQAPVSSGTQRHWVWAAAAVVLAVGAWAAWLRWPHLQSGLWLDEFGTLWASRGAGDGETIRRVYAVHGQSPLYYLVVRWTTGLLGESELTLRLPSFVLGSALPLLGAWAVLPQGRRRAGAALLLFATHPAFLFHAQQARPYTLGAALVVLSVLGLYRALASGSGRARLLAWGAFVAATYAHPVFGPSGAALLAAVAACPTPRRYGFKTALTDALLAGLTLIPVLAHSGGLFGRRAELTWIRSFDPYTLPILFPGILPVLAVCGTLLLWRWKAGLPARRQAAPAWDRGALACELALTFLPLLAVLAVWLGSGVSLLTSRYLLLSGVGAALLCARLIGGLPWPLAALTLAFVVFSSESQAARSPRSSPEWRAALSAVDTLQLEPKDPVVVVPGYVEVDRMAYPPFALPPQREAFLGAPVTQRPGLPPDHRPLALLPAGWGQSPHQLDYLEQRVVPLLGSARRFAVIAPPAIEADFGNWLAWRFPGRFQRLSRSREFLTVGVVSSWASPR